eukprot:gene22797-43063_t
MGHPHLPSYRAKKLTWHTGDLTAVGVLRWALERNGIMLAELLAPLTATRAPAAAPDLRSLQGALFGKSGYADAALSAAAVGVMVEWMELRARNLTSQYAGLMLDAYGGAVADLAAAATAFPHRAATVQLQLIEYGK